MIMKKIFLFLVIAGAIGVIGTGILDNYITLDTQELNKFEGVNSLTDCVCEDPQNPGTFEPCNEDDVTPMCDFSP